jgi:hypothetical protein
MFRRFLRNISFTVFGNQQALDDAHYEFFNECREDDEIEPTVITGPTTQDTSASGNRYTQGLIYHGFGTTYLDIILEEVATVP